MISQPEAYEKKDQETRRKGACIPIISWSYLGEDA